MVTDTRTGVKAEVVAAWATGVGIGVFAFMVTWPVVNRLTELVMVQPGAAIVAMLTAILVGVTTSVGQGRRLARRVRAEIAP